MDSAKLKALAPMQEMSQEQLKAFWEAVGADASLQHALQAVTDPDAIVRIAKKSGFMISADEVKATAKEISEEDLEGVVGGLHPYPPSRVVPPLSRSAANRFFTD